MQDEMRQGLSYFQETIFDGLPKFLRRIDTALKNIGQPMLPLDHCLFKFGSWCGQPGFNCTSFCTTALQQAHSCRGAIIEQQRQLSTGWAVTVMATHM